MLQENREYVLMSDPSVTVTVKPETTYEGGPTIWTMVSGPERLSSARWADNGYAIGSDISFAARPGDLIEKDRLHQLEIPVRDVLALLKEGKTDFFTCYNVAVCMIPYFESHHYEKWARHKEWSMENTVENYGDDRLITSGYYAFNFVMNNFVSGVFEYCIINQLCEWLYARFGAAGKSFQTLMQFADRAGMTNRELRIQLMEFGLSQNPDATFKVLF